MRITRQFRNLKTGAKRVFVGLLVLCLFCTATGIGSIFAAATEDPDNTPCVHENTSRESAEGACYKVVCADCGEILQTVDHSYSWADNGDGTESYKCVECGDVQETRGKEPDPEPEPETEPAPSSNSTGMSGEEEESIEEATDINRSMRLLGAGNAVNLTSSNLPSFDDFFGEAKITAKQGLVYNGQAQELLDNVVSTPPALPQNCSNVSTIVYKMDNDSTHQKIDAGSYTVTCMFQYTYNDNGSSSTKQAEKTIYVDIAKKPISELTVEPAAVSFLYHKRCRWHNIKWCC